MEASVAVMPVVVGLLAGVAFKPFWAVEVKSGISCLTAILNIIVPRKYQKYQKYHWLDYKENHEELQQQYRYNMRCTSLLEEMSCRMLCQSQ